MAKQQKGQAMVEYTVVLFFGLILMFKAFSLQGVSPSVHDTGGYRSDSVPGLMLGVLKDNFQGYSYAMSLSDIPDDDTLFDFLADPKNLGQASPQALFGQLTQGVFTHFPALPNPAQMPLVTSAGNLFPSSISFPP